MSTLFLIQLHYIADLPEHYVFWVRCYLQPGCLHPLSLKVQEDPEYELPSTWFPKGPSVQNLPLPLPVPDPNRTWGRPDCAECRGLCHGHYMKPEDLILSRCTQICSSTISCNLGILQNKSATGAEIAELAKRALLPVNDVKIWLTHLEEVQRNLKRGAAQAALTSKAKRAAANRGQTDSTVPDPDPPTN